MRKLLGFSLLLAGGIVAQTSETIPFRAVLLPSNEVPPVNIEARGGATTWVHVVRDAAGQIVSGSVDFDVNYTFPSDVRFTGLHIHRGAAGFNGPVTINTGISAANPIDAAAGAGVIKRQGQATSQAALDTIRGMLENPADFYVNLHTAVHPDGVIRGQLQRAEMVVLMGLMSPANEVPPITGTNASGIGTVIALMTRDASGAVSSGQVIFDANYTGFTEDTRFTGFHIHAGPAGATRPVTIDTRLTSMPVASGGAGNLHFEVEVPMTSAAAVSTLEDLFRNPHNYYINLHTAVNPGGVIRSQLRNTDRMHFPVTMLTSNEEPPITTLDARAESAVTVHTLRDATGNVVAGTVIFDINPRFPGETTFTGLHIHNGLAGANGGVTINTGLGTGANSVVTPTGMANIYRAVTVSNTAGLATLNSLVMNPERHYVNLHTTVHPDGAVRAQVVSANTAMPSVSAVISSISDPNVRTVAPGGLMSIFGSNLTKVTSGFSGGESAVSTSLNGVQVTVANRPAPIIVLQPGVIVAQVPAETPAGSQPLVVTTPNGASTSAQVTVATSAPAIFYDATGGIVVKNDTFQLVRPDNPARAGEILVIYATGLGAVSGMNTGQIVPSDRLINTNPVTVTIGGSNADVIYSLASPGFLGLYQIAVRVPAGVAAGNRPLVVRAGAVSSNSVNIAVQ